MMNNMQQPAPQNYVTGTVASIFFQNPDNFFKILLVKIQNSDIPDFKEPEIVVQGNFGDIKEEQTYTFKGHPIDHPRYGFQFKADNYETDTPTTKEGLINYLSGSQFKGIGAKTAEKIVDRLGTQAIDKIIQDSKVLEGLGISYKKRQDLAQTLQDNVGMEKAIISLNSFGFGSNLATQIYQKYKETTIQVLKENPYQLVYDITGVGFKRADRIAEKQGIGANAPERYQAAILQTLNDLTFQEGDTYTSAVNLQDGAVQLLQTSRPQPVDMVNLTQQMQALAKNGKLISQDHRLYPAFLFRSEWQIAEHLYRLSDAESEHVSDSEVMDLIEQAEKHLDITYDESQKQAIKQSLNASVSLLTGGPGTGKTTVLNGIVYCFSKHYDFSLDINVYKDETFPVLLAAPTGRAAKRISEMTGLPASTIHRLLGLNGHEETQQDVETNELSGKLLIVDEMSMVDTALFRQLIKSVASGMHVVLVGDKDQLPSVGPGQVFADLLKSHDLPKQELKRIYRQDKGSSIIPLAHEINDGVVTPDFFENQTDRSFIKCSTNQIPNVIEQIVSKAKAKGFGTKDMQVLIPMYKGPAGIDHLNPLVQDIMNPKKSNRTKEMKFGSFAYRIGDKVLHLVNSPDLNVFNGEIGQIVAITAAKENTDHVDKITIDFDGNEVTYKRSEWQRFTLAYCTSIHKAQGSEFPLVILPLVMQFRRMLKRNLLYTAVTRAKSLLIMLGDPKAFEMAVHSLANNRKTSLVLRIEDVFAKTNNKPAINKNNFSEKPSTESPVVNSDSSVTVETANDNNTEDDQATILTDALIVQGTIDPMIGMKGVTPQSFMVNGY